MSSIFIPPGNDDLDIRPLNKGMILDKPPQSLPDGAFLKLENFTACLEGLRRRNGFQRFAANDHTPYTMLNLITLWKSDGSQETILITDKILYRVSAFAGLTEIIDVYDTGTVAITGDAVTGASTAWLTADVIAGDLFRCDGEEAEIASVDSDTGITLKAALSSQSAGTAYEIVRAFNVQSPNFVDHVARYNSLLLSDGLRPIRKYDADTATLGYFITNAAYGINGSEDVIPISVSQFLNRTWVGYTHEDTDGYRRQRIRWDKITVPGDFSTVTSWLELDQTSGSIRRMVPLGNTLVVYLDDGIYFLIQTNIPTLPLRPEKIETGGIGLIGQRAVCPWMGGHFFVGQDDIYFLGNNGIEPVGSPIIREALKNCTNPEYIQAAADPANFRVLFGFPQGAKTMEYLWAFDPRAKAWSYDKRTTYMLANPVINSTVTWDDLTGTDWDTLTTTYPSWNQIRNSDVFRNLYIESGGRLITSEAEYSVDWNGVDDTIPIMGIITTKDFDMDKPSLGKVFSRVSFTLNEFNSRTLPITFLVEVSVNKGRNWKTCGTLHIPINRSEGYVNFKATGSIARFRFTTSSQVAPYDVSEMSLRASPIGSEGGLSNRNT